MKRTLPLERTQLRELIHAALSEERAPAGELSFAFVSDSKMRGINRDFRGIDRPTDVLSFSYLDEPHAGGVLGEVYVAPNVAEHQAKEAGCPWEEELARLSLHGLLHVLGYEHDTTGSRRRMLGLQERYLKRFFRRVS